MDIKEMNIILEYLKLPKNSYYASLLEKKLSSEGIKALIEQKKALDFIDTAKNIDFQIDNINIFDSITQKIEKISNKQKSFFNKSLIFIKETFLIPSIFLISLGINLLFVNKIKNKVFNFNINENKKIVFQKINQKYNYIYDKFDLNLNKYSLYSNSRFDYKFDDDIYYIGDTKNYKNIFDGVNDTMNYLDNADKELKKGNYKKGEALLNVALLKQHDVNVINKKDNKNGGK